MKTASPPLLRLWRHAAAHRRRIVLAAVCSFLNRLFDLAPPALIGAAVDIVVRRENSLLAGFGLADPRQQLVVLAVVTVIVWGFESLFEYAHAVLWRNLAQTVQHELRLDAYRHIQGLELAYFEDRSTGGLLAVLNDDINQLERFLDGGANSLIQLATTVGVVGTVFFVLAPTVAWMSFMPIPFILWGSFLFQAKIAPRYADVRARVSALSAQLSNNLGGIATIKSFTAEKREAARIEDESDRYRQANRRAIRMSSAFVPLIRILIVVGFGAMLVYGGDLTLDGGMAVGAYSVLVFFTQRLLWPLTTLGQTFDLYQRAMASTNRVLDLLAKKARIVDGPRPLEPGAVRGEVRFEGVEFAYEEGFPVLRGLDLAAGAGETIGIVGATGAGKSTIIKLLLRFYEAGAGTVRLDGFDLRELRLSDLRRAIGLVSQDVFLFHGSVRENIAYGRPEASDEEIVRAARIAEAHDFIADLPRGYDTIVGERGQKLSGGQRQRLSIARAVLKDPPILILDEATSSVDNETEAAIQRSLLKISRDRTTLVIAHRLSTIRHADRIFVLEGGRVAEEGTHGGLIEQNGLYAGLWNVQTGAAVAALTAGHPRP